MSISVFGNCSYNKLYIYICYVHICIIYISQDSMPPIMSFHMGSLGFLTPFTLGSYKTDINRVFNGIVIIVITT